MDPLLASLESSHLLQRKYTNSLIYFHVSLCSPLFSLSIFEGKNPQMQSTKKNNVGWVLHLDRYILTFVFSHLPHSASTSDNDKVIYSQLEHSTNICTKKPISFNGLYVFSFCFKEMNYT